MEKDGDLRARLPSPWKWPPPPHHRLAPCALVAWPKGLRAALPLLPGHCRPPGWEAAGDLVKDSGSRPGRAGSWEPCFHGSTSPSAWGTPAWRPLTSTSFCSRGRDLGVQLLGVKPTSAAASSVTLAELLNLSEPPSSHLQHGHNSRLSKFSRGFNNIRHTNCPAQCWHADMITAR